VQNPESNILFIHRSFIDSPPENTMRGFSPDRGSEPEAGRRHFLATAGAATAGFAASMSAIQGLSSPAIASELKRQDKRVILLWLAGGASQFETWDPKPGTSTGGPFRAIQTNATGVHISELLPELAQRMHMLLQHRKRGLFFCATCLLNRWFQKLKGCPDFDFGKQVQPSCQDCGFNHRMTSSIEPLKRSPKSLMHNLRFHFGTLTGCVDLRDAKFEPAAAVHQHMPGNVAGGLSRREFAESADGGFCNHADLIHNMEYSSPSGS
jgi:hypothetical protein